LFPDTLELAGEKCLTSKIVFYGNDHRLKRIILFVRTELVLRIDLDFSNFQLKLLGEFGLREGVVASFFGQHGIDIALLIDFDFI
jgi:hypothetical protein